MRKPIANLQPGSSVSLFKWPPGAPPDLDKSRNFWRRMAPRVSLRSTHALGPRRQPLASRDAERVGPTGWTDLGPCGGWWASRPRPVPSPAPHQSHSPLSCSAASTERSPPPISPSLPPATSSSSSCFFIRSAEEEAGGRGHGAYERGQQRLRRPGRADRAALAVPPARRARGQISVRFHPQFYLAFSLAFSPVPPPDLANARFDLLSRGAVSRVFWQLGCWFEALDSERDPVIWVLFVMLDGLEDDRYDV